MYESSGLQQFFRTTIQSGIQSGPSAFDESRFVMTYLTNFGVTEVLCSFKLVLEGKTSKQIHESSRLEFLKKFFSKQFCSIRYRRQPLRAVEWRSYSRFTFVQNTISKIPKVPRSMFLANDVLLCFISICKFGSFKNPFAAIASLSELYCRFRRSILLVQTKKVIFMNYGSSTSSLKP